MIHNLCNLFIVHNYQVAKRRPNDADAKLKFTECNKIVKKQAFERAIAVDRPDKTLSEMYQSLDSICKKQLTF